TSSNPVRMPALCWKDITLPSTARKDKHRGRTREGVDVGGQSGEVLKWVLKSLGHGAEDGTVSAKKSRALMPRRVTRKSGARAFHAGLWRRRFPRATHTDGPS